MRILKITKTGKAFQKSPLINYITGYFKIRMGLAKLIYILILVIFMNHIMSCFWYFVARLEDFNPKSWVVRMNILDKDYTTKYITSYYW